MFRIRDRVRVLGKHGNEAAVGSVVAVTAKDRTHVSRRVKGRPLFSVLDDEGRAWDHLPGGRLRAIGPALSSPATVGSRPTGS